MAASPDSNPSTLATLLAAHGSVIGAFAYLSLQHQTDADRIVADTLASASRRTDFPTTRDAQRIWLLRKAARLILRGSTQSGEVKPLLPDPRSFGDRIVILEALAEQPPRSRVALTLRYFSDLSPDEVALVLDADPVAQRSELNEARNGLQARADELMQTEFGEIRDSSAGPSPPAEPFDERLRRALREEATRYVPFLDVNRARSSAASVRLPRSRTAWWPLALAALVAAAAAAFFMFVPDSSPAANGSSARSPGGEASVRPSDNPITLADCQITPADASLSYQGWTTLAALNVQGGEAGPGQPIFALVTRGLAEWVGWQTKDAGPMFPAPVARMGCIFDPSTGHTSIVGVDAEWEPNILADGCPASQTDSFGGYREIGGPHAWLLLPENIASWRVGDVKYLMLFRLSPPAEPGQTISAWAQPLADGSPIAAEVASGASSVKAPQTSGGGSRYYFVNVTVTRHGCWVINIAVNGAVVGSAIVPIGGFSGQATPVPETTVP